ncbi:MAG: HEAT repeat domain-containing protein [Calothrix sp. MO_167.B12]|nr:HEAT repeat domain-containing protein [Calothrix sp. MO_167.B12]
MAFYTYCKSTFSQPKRLTVKIAFTLLSFSSPLLLCNTSWSQTVTPTPTTVLAQNQEKQNEISEDVESNSQDVEIKLNEIDSELKNYTLNINQKKAISVFRENLNYPNKQVKIHALNALSAIGTGADDALENLKNMLKTETDRDVLSSTIWAIRSIGAKSAISELINVFKDEKQNLEVRSLASETIIFKTEETKKLIPYLLDLLEDKNINKTKLRISATKILSNILYQFDENDYDLEHAVKTLIKSLKDPAWRVRRNSADALGNMGVNAKSSVSKLFEAYKREPNNTMRHSVVIAFGKIGKGDSQAALEILPHLIYVLEDPRIEHGNVVRGRAVNSLRLIATRLEGSTQDKNKKKNDLNNTISKLDQALKAIENWDEDKDGKELILFQSDIKYIRSILNELQSTRIKDQIIKSPSVWGIGTYLVLLFGIFWLRPLWLLKIDKALKSVGTFKLPVVEKEISLSWLLLMLKYRPRVLDAWVKAHLKPAQEAFQQKNTVSDRNVYIPIPVICNGKTDAQLTGKDLRLTFNKQKACLLIQGEGGVGKTSLACQIANWAMSDDEAERLCKHRMLPILIEEELEISQDIEIEASLSKKPPSIVALIEAIQGQLQNLTDEMEPVSQELLERLLRGCLKSMFINIKTSQT